MRTPRVWSAPRDITVGVWLQVQKKGKSLTTPMPLVLGVVRGETGLKLSTREGGETLFFLVPAVGLRLKMDANERESGHAAASLGRKHKTHKIALRFNMSHYLNHVEKQDIINIYRIFLNKDASFSQLALCVLCITLAAIPKENN